MSDDPFKPITRWLVIFYIAAGLMAAFAACREPDAIRLGVGYRDEQFGDAIYDGPRIYLEGEWVLRPTIVQMSPGEPLIVDLSDASKLFLSEQEAHRGARADTPDVAINLPDMGPPAPPEPTDDDGHADEIKAVADLPGYFWIGLPIALLALSVPLAVWVWGKRQRVEAEKPDAG